jgi:hypothetical protein
MRTCRLRVIAAALATIELMLPSAGRNHCAAILSIRGGCECAVEDRRSPFEPPRSHLERSSSPLPRPPDNNLNNPNLHLRSPPPADPPTSHLPTPFAVSAMPPSDPTAALSSEPASAPPALLHAQTPGVREPLVRALLSSGVTSLTPVQLAALPVCLAGGDVLARARTGTGKTLAFLIPTVERVLRLAREGEGERIDGVHDPIRALVLSPTRELAAQIAAQASKLVEFVPGFLVESVLGGGSIVPQRERLDPAVGGPKRYAGAVDLLVATPGRLIEHLDGTAGVADRLRGVQVRTQTHTRTHART